MTYEEFVKELVNKGYMFRIFQCKDFYITEWSSYFEDTEDVAYLSLEVVGEYSIESREDSYDKREREQEEEEYYQLEELLRRVSETKLEDRGKLDISYLYGIMYD